jgi:hypothetical protein
MKHRLAKECDHLGSEFSGTRVGSGPGGAVFVGRVDGGKSIKAVA